MGELKIGDIVARKSYGYDIFFKVVDINKTGQENMITLKGISYRIQADAPESDLVLQPDERVREYRTKCMRTAERKTQEIYASRHNLYSKKAFYRSTPNENTRRFSRPGKVLHIDGDSDYLTTCLTEYRKLGINAVGESTSERQQAMRVRAFRTVQT
jgi:spore coat assembly protein